MRSSHLSLVSLTKSPQSSCIIISLGYLIYSPPAPIRQFIQSHVGSRLTRIRADRLIRWAEEDIAMLEDEEGVMVNADDRVDYDTMDEEIPLKPSPKRSNFLTKYGSTQS